MENKELKKKSKEILITKQGGNQKEGGLHVLCANLT